MEILPQPASAQKAGSEMEKTSPPAALKLTSKANQPSSSPCHFALFLHLEERPLKGLWQFALLSAICVVSLGNTRGTPGHSHGPDWRALHTPGFEHNLRGPRQPSQILLLHIPPAHLHSHQS